MNLEEYVCGAQEVKEVLPINKLKLNITTIHPVPLFTPAYTHTHTHTHLYLIVCVCAGGGGGGLTMGKTICITIILLRGYFDKHFDFGVLLTHTHTS